MDFCFSKENGERLPCKDNIAQTSGQLKGVQPKSKTQQNEKVIETIKLCLHLIFSVGRVTVIKTVCRL